MLTHSEGPIFVHISNPWSIFKPDGSYLIAFECMSCTFVLSILGMISMIRIFIKSVRSQSANPISKMTPELFQSYVLGVYSFLFFGLAWMLLVRKRCRLWALSSHPPCLHYLQIRMETVKLFDRKQDSSSLTRIADLTLQIRDLFRFMISLSF